MEYITPEVKAKEQFYALCYERERITGKNFAINLKTQKTIMSHYENIYKHQPFVLPGQNQRIAHLLSEVFQKLNYTNKSFGSLMTNIRDGKDSYRVWGLSSHPKEEYKTLDELKKGIASGDVIITGYCKRDEQYAAFINNIEKLKHADKHQPFNPVRQEYQYGLQTKRTLASPIITNNIMSIKTNIKYKDPMYGTTGYQLETKMDANVIPFIDILQKDENLSFKYSNELLIVISYLSFASANAHEAKRYVDRLVKYHIAGHDKSLVEEAFASYLASPTTDDVDPNY